MLSLLCVLAVVSGEVENETERPNVLFIAVDDLRVQLGCYGQPVETPHIDRLAAAGCRFERAYCQQTVCNPSRASVLTGLRPDTLGVYDLHTHFREKRPKVQTLPQRFKADGYHTRCIGKVFHNWVQPNRRGDKPSWSVPSVLHYAHHGDDVPHVGWMPLDTAGISRTERRDVPDDAYFDGRVAKLASETLAAYGQHAADAPQETIEPFFLAVGFWKPHAPFNAPERYWQPYDERPDAIAPLAATDRPEGVPDLAMHAGLEINRGFRDRPGKRPTDADARMLRHGYAAAISYLDAQVGRVLAALEASGLRERTLVVFWSDHGYHLGEQSLWAKTSVFELDARVPLLIAAPGQPAGVVVETPVELLDLYPTLCELAAVKLPPGLEGRSLVPLLDGSQSAVAAFAEAKPVAMTQHPRPAYLGPGEEPTEMGRSVTDGRYRFTRWQKHNAGDPAAGATLAVELYDHEADPGESRNLADDPDAASTIDRLTRRLDALVGTQTQPTRD